MFNVVVNIIVAVTLAPVHDGHEVAHIVFHRSRVVVDVKPYVCAVYRAS